MNFTQHILAVFKTMSTAQAILAASVVIAGAILLTSVFQPAAPLLPNPQGGIWVRASGTLFLCRAAVNEPSPCVDLRNGAATTFDKLDIEN